MQFESFCSTETTLLCVKEEQVFNFSRHFSCPQKISIQENFFFPFRVRFLFQDDVSIGEVKLKSACLPLQSSFFNLLKKRYDRMKPVPGCQMAKTGRSGNSGSSGGRIIDILIGV